MEPNRTGRLGEQWSEEAARARGEVIAGKQVELTFTIRGKRVTVRADFLIEEEGGIFTYIESKYSARSTYQPNQQIVIPELVKAGDAGLPAVVGSGKGLLLRPGRTIQVRFQGDVWTGKPTLLGDE
jgi:hypothetical protein